MMLNQRVVNVLFLLSLCLCMALAGCAKPRIELAVASQPNVNPDTSGRPSPLIVKMYEMTGDLAFNQSDFDALFNQPRQTLGAALVAADEVVFVPSEAKTVSYQPMPETRFVGIVAGFRQMERAHWRGIVPVNPEKRNIINIELNDTTLLLVNDEDWSPEESLKNYQTRLNTSSPSDKAPAAKTTVVPGHNNSATTAEGLDATVTPDTAPQPAGYVVPKSQRMDSK